VYSTDTDYEYRQESNFLYLTGFDEEPATLVLVPGASGPRSFLFIRQPDAFRELWTGPMSDPEEAAERTGIAHVFTQDGTEAFDAFMQALLGRGVPQASSEAAQAGASVGLDAARSVRLMILDDLSQPAEDRQVARQVEWARTTAANRPNTTLASAAPVLERIRRVKTPYEQRVMRRAVEIAADAHVEGMRATRPGRWEYEVEAAIEYWFLRNGAMSWGYPSIVGSGPNATILHYVKSRRQMRSGDLLLVDAGANFQGLTGDITRTYPVNGRFSSEQRVLYQIVLSALEAGIEAARPGGSVAAINAAVRRVIGRGLLEVGLVTDPKAATGESSQIDLWFPHGPVHGIGMDVHESLGPLVPGVTFVVEPGLYIRPEALDALTGTAQQRALADAVRPAMERFRYMGIRVEDSLLMTSSGPEVMSLRAPRSITALERVVGSGR
jgi:Xaa-Pro aminopeptidase